MNKQSYLNYLQSELQELRQNIIFCQSSIQNAKRLKAEAFKQRRFKEWRCYKREIKVLKKRITYSSRVIKKMTKIVAIAAKIKVKR